MPYKESMTWRDSHRRWQKMYKGTMYYVRASDLHGVMLYTRDASRAAANDWWDRKRAEIDGVQVGPLLRRLQSLPQDDLVRMADPVVTTRQELAARILASLGQDEADAIRTILGGREYHYLADRLDDVAEIVAGGRRAVAVDKRLSVVAKKFLAVAQGEMRPVSFTELRLETDTHVRQLGADLDVSTIDADTVETVYLRLKRADVAQSVRAKRWGFFRRLVRYCAERDLCPLPKNLDGLTFKITVQKVKTYPLADVRALLAKLPSRLRLYALMCLNFGMTNADLGRCTKDMIDLEKGILVRKRGKTSDNENVPTVTYTIWPETLELLRQHWSSHPTLVLVSKRGTSMYESTYGADQDTSKKDLFVKQWRGEKVQIPLMKFRSIAATVLESHGEYGRYVPHFLGHSVKSIHEKHYAPKSERLFGEALTWLRMEILGDAG